MYIRASVQAPLEGSHSVQLNLAMTAQDPRVLKDLAASPFRDVRLAVAKNPKAADALRGLAQDKHLDMRKLVLANPSLPKDLKKRLDIDYSYYFEFHFELCYPNPVTDIAATKKSDAFIEKLVRKYIKSTASRRLEMAYVDGHFEDMDDAFDDEENYGREFIFTCYYTGSIARYFEQPDYLLDELTEYLSGGNLWDNSWSGDYECYNSWVIPLVVR